MLVLFIIIVMFDWVKCEIKGLGIVESHVSAFV